MSTTKPHPLATLTTPDEDPAKLEALIMTLAAELAPRTHLERRQVELIAHAEWEITRHRRQSAQLLATEANRIRLSEEKDYVRLLTDFNLLEECPPEPPSPERMAEFAARAYANSFHFHAHHEASTERLEARRRQLLRDYQELQSRHDRAAATDAEVVTE
jgi:hypothetical protein